MENKIKKKKKLYIWIYIAWSIYSIGFILGSIVLWILSLKSILVLEFQIWLEPNHSILIFEIITMINCYIWFLHIIFLWSISVVKNLTEIKGSE